MTVPTSIQLPMWAGYRRGREDDASTGEVEVRIHAGPVTTRQRAAIAATVRRGTPMKAVLLDAIVSAYPTFREWQPRPRSITKAELKKRALLWGIIVTRDHHEDVAYVGYVFSCTWDPSGFVVLTHGDRVVSAGGLEVLEYPHRDAVRSAPKPRSVTPAQRRAAKAGAEKQAKKNPATLRVDDAGEMLVHMPAWAGFRAGPWSKLSKGLVRVAVGGDSVGQRPVGPEQEAAYRRVLGRAAGAQRLVLDAIVGAYAKLTRRADAELALPVKVDRAALVDLVELLCVHVHWAHRDGVAYVGYQLACVWDPEHDLGVLTHVDRVVAVGQADTSFLGWVAERDQRRRRKRR